MRKNLLYINNQKGFVLPLVLLIAALLFLFVSTNVAIYKNEMIITKNELAQLKIDTLFQMSRAKFKDEIATIKQDKGTVDYIFPNGRVKIAYEFLPVDIYQLTFSVDPLDDKLLVITNQMKLPKAQMNTQTDLGQTKSK